VIVGSGLGGLALGALLARRGTSVTVLEAHPSLVGGCAQTIRQAGYSFSLGPRYLWNFGQGQIGQRFLQACGIADRVPLVEMDRSGFDRVHVGDGPPIAVPNGWEDYGRLLAIKYPDQSGPIAEFFSLCRRVFDLFDFADENGLVFDTWGEVFRKYLLTRRLRASDLVWLMARERWTLRDAFDRCGLSPRLRAILYAHGLIFAEPVERVSFLAYAAGTLAYHRGCYYPEQDMLGLVQALVELIRGHGGDVLLDSRVVEVTADASGSIRTVRTASGAEHGGDIFVADIDPRTFLGMVRGGWSNASLAYPILRRSGSATMYFLGIRDAAVLTPAFGRWNVWYVADPSPPGPGEGEVSSQLRHLFLNSPTLLKGATDDAPTGGATLVAGVPSDYHDHRAVFEDSPSRYEAFSKARTEVVLDLIEAKFAPGLRANLDVSIALGPLEIESVLHAPEGNIYGRSLRAGEVLRRARWRGPGANLHFVGASIGFAGVASVIRSACRVFQELTGERI
jgi:all-trans-retinol 13,14-reductase